MNLRVLAFLLAMAAALTSCNHPYAQLSALQDPKYRVTRESKIAMGENFNPQTADIATRLAGETIAEQMRAMGFHLTTPAEAEYMLAFTVADKEEQESYTVSVPTISNMVGTSGNYPVSGTVFGSESVPQTRMVSRTHLKLWLQRMQEPKVDVWQGTIVANATDARQYRASFFHALLERVGETANGQVQLDQENKPAK